MKTLTRRNWLLTTSVIGAGMFTLPQWLTAAESPGEMVLIPAGTFSMGTSSEQAAILAGQYDCHVSWLSGEVPPRTLTLAAFKIDRYPVTNQQYARFCAATGAKVPGHWLGGKPPGHLLEHPVVYVCRAEARAYAKWIGKRLPTEAEWEKAARGTDGRLYPWGNQFEPQACQWDRDAALLPSGTAPVTAHPRGASPYGVQDMVGNVLEWCEDGPGADTAFVKGGCWLTATPLNLRVATRGMSGNDRNQLPYIGFRCAQEA
jgi:formylglycine-generating enzyme required for sulfatase activity